MGVVYMAFFETEKMGPNTDSAPYLMSYDSLGGCFNLLGKNHALFMLFQARTKQCIQIILYNSSQSMLDMGKVCREV